MKEAKQFEQIFPKRDRCRQKVHEKVIITIREMQIKTTIHPTRMAKMKKTDNTKGWQKVEGTRAHVLLVRIKYG